MPDARSFRIILNSGGNTKRADSIVCKQGSISTSVAGKWLQGLCSLFPLYFIAVKVKHWHGGLYPDGAENCHKKDEAVGVLRS